MRTFQFLSLTAVLLFSAVCLQAQIDVTVAGKRGNDTLYISGFDGTPETAARVRRDLTNCGWFDVVKTDAAIYRVTGSSTGNSVTLNLSDGAGNPVTTVSAGGQNPAEASRRAVDALLRMLYQIDGICCSRIIFSVETRPQIKEIYSCAYDGSDIRRVTSNGGLSLDPIWTPGGQTIIYSFIGGNTTSLVEQDLRSGRSRRLAAFKGLNAGGRVSPDGKTVALILSRDGQVDLYTRPLNGGALKRLTFDRAVEASPCWSPDGSKICYVSDAGSGRPRLRIISAAGGTAERVGGALGSESVSPSWAKDGKIVYSARVGGYTLGVVNVSNSKQDPRQMEGIIMKNGSWESPSWAPDNRHAVCISRGGLYVVDTWTGKARKILGGASKMSVPNWSPIQR